MKTAAELDVARTERAIAVAAAHDINEELTILLGSLRQARAIIVGYEFGELPRHLRLAEEAAYRATATTRKVLSYVQERGQKTTFGKLDLKIAVNPADV